jgi:hypothetical protein
MNDEELRKAFPFGVNVIPREDDDLSFLAAVGGDTDTDETFSVWDNPFHYLELDRDIEPSNDGFVALGVNGQKYFLRPLDEAHKVEV